MSVEPPTYGVRHRHGENDPADEDTRAIGQVAARVDAWLSGSSRGDAPTHPDELDARPRRWDVVDPSATRIGHAADPEADVDERLRDLHAERHSALQGNDERCRRLDVARVTQAVCNSLDLTPWERDRVLGVVAELDAGTAVASRRSVAAVALVVARRVVDAERRAWLGLDDDDWLDEQPPDRLAELSERLHQLTDGDAYDRLLAECGVTTDAASRIDELLTQELDAETRRSAAFGRSPYRDPWLPAFEPHAPRPDGTGSR